MTVLQNHIKAIVFDLGNVLCDIDVLNPIQKLETLSTVEDNKEQTFQFLSQMHSDFMRGLYSADQFLNSLKRTLKIERTENEIKGIWNEIIVGVRTQAYSLLTELNENLEVYLLSNTDEIHVDKITNDNPEFFKFFKNTFLSFQLRLIKPETEIFIHTVEACQQNPSQILFIDDSFENIKSARSIGINAEQAESLNQILTILKKYDILVGNVQRREQ